MKALLANMGFVLQIAGAFVIIPIIVSFIFNETSSTIGLFITATVFFALGFISNSLCEKKELSYKQSCMLIVLVFVSMSLIGSLPYIYINLPSGNLLHVITDSIFESTSGFTTTGFSVLPDITTLPRSLILYRSLTQFIGGIGIVLVLLAFFYPEAKLKEFARSMGLSKDYKAKKAFMLIILIYSALMAIMITIGYIFGYRDLINLASVIFSSLSTGGFSPVADMTKMATEPPLNYIILTCMIFGACNFLVFAGLFKKKIKEFFNSEISVFFGLAITSIALVIVFFKFSIYDAVFHVLSAMSTTGFNYLPVASFPDSLKLLFVILMLIGGASFSTAGGIKVYRFVLLLKATKKAVIENVTEKTNGNVKLFGREYTNADIIQAAVLVLLTIVIVVISSIVVSFYGFTAVDSLFESTSAIATTGLSAGVISPTIALELKWLFSALMLIGRVEVFAILVLFFKGKKTSDQQCSSEKTEEMPTTESPTKTSDTTGPKEA